MSENKTNTSQPTNKVAKKPSFKTFWIAGLAAFLIISVVGSVFYTMTQKTSKSQASSVTGNRVPKAAPKLCKIAGVDQPCPPPSRKPTIKPVQKPEINPYTGEKQ